MKSLKWVLAAMAVSLVAACGGGGGCSGTPGFGTAASGAGVCGSGSGPSPAASVDVLASSVQVGTGGDTVTISAVVKDANNVGLGGATVGFSTSTGTLTGAAGVTDATGTATATFSAGSDRSNRTATVTVTSGSVTGTVQLAIVGTTISYSGVTTVPLAGTATVGVKVVDSKGAALSGQSITVQSTINNGLSASTITTNSQGTASVVYTATTAGADTLTFKGAGTSVSPSIQVSAADFTFVAPASGTQITVGQPQALTVKYLNNGAPVAGQTINFSATAGTVNPVSLMTDASGQATVSIQSATASQAVVQATVAGASVQATLLVVFVAQAPASVVLQASPTAIGPNPAGTSAQQSALTATVTDANGNPVSGATVTFNRQVDPSGGNLSQPSAVTDSSGNATVQYIAGALSTASNGVVLQASVAGTSVISPLTYLTVNQGALFIALGTGNVITNVDPQTYKKDWVVYVTDATGNAVPNVSLTISVLPTRYGKGYLTFQSGTWAINVNPGPYYDCANEDANYNGIIDPNEDFNHDGVLQPGNVISVSTNNSTPGVVKTDSTGRATVSLIYAESYVPWVRVKLRAQAQVTGTAGSTTQEFVVPGLASDFTAVGNPPAGVFSPFGVNDCATPN